MRGKALSLGLMCLGISLSGCGMNHEIIDPFEVVNPSDDNHQPSETHHALDHLILETKDHDLFYLDEQLTQFNLTNQVAYFEYLETEQILKAKKQNGQWVIWHLENQKPHFIEKAEQVLPTLDRRTTYFTGEQNVGLFKYSNKQQTRLTNEVISRVEVTSDGQFIVFLTDSNTLKIMTSHGAILRTESDVLAYRLDKESQSVTVWSDEDISILKLKDQRVTVAKYFLGVTDWLYAPYYSNEFETLAYMTELDLEAGVGTLAIETTHAAHAMTIPNVKQYLISDDGVFVYYLNQQLELYQVDLVKEKAYFLGKGMNQMNLECFESYALYRNELELHVIDSSHDTTLISDDVSKYEANERAIVYTDSLRDLYLIQNQNVEALAKDVTSFSLGENGVFYEANNQIVYHHFEGQNEVLVANRGNYQSIFHQNSSLYQVPFTINDLIGTWEYRDDVNLMTYVFNEDNTFQIKQQTAETVQVTEGTYTILVTHHEGLNVSLTDQLGQTTFLSVSGVDDLTIDVAEDEHVYQLKCLLD